MKVVMNSTRRALRHKAITLKQRVCNIENFKLPVQFGESGDIQTKEISGKFCFNETAVNIDGCNWRGAAHIYFTANAFHKSISDRDCFYFMMSSVGTASMNKQAIFIILFHHLYTKLQLPFRTDIEDKFKILLAHLKEEIYESEIISIQRELGLVVFRDWTAFMRMFDVNSHNEAVCIFQESERYTLLRNYTVDAEGLLDFLTSPIESIDVFLQEMKFVKDINRDDIVSLILEKLDSHEIYMTTGEMPINVDWLRRLDVILKRSY